MEKILTDLISAAAGVFAVSNEIKSKKKPEQILLIISAVLLAADTALHIINSGKKEKNKAKTV